MQQPDLLTYSHGHRPLAWTVLTHGRGSIRSRGGATHFTRCKPVPHQTGSPSMRRRTGVVLWSLIALFAGAADAR